MADPAPSRAVFFDRDGVLNVDTGYVFRAQDFVWRPGATECVAWLNARGVLVFVVTNQSGVARGIYREIDVIRLHGHLQDDLFRIGAWIDAFRYCPHHPEGIVAAYRLQCKCRKPASGMIDDLLACYALDPARCHLFGDKMTDLDAALAAGVPATLVTDEAPLIDFVRPLFEDVTGS